MTGTNVSYDGGKNWEPISDQILHGMVFTANGKIGYGMGLNGKIVKILVKNIEQNTNVKKIKDDALRYIILYYR